jgi:hypothetical protein
VTFEGKLTKYGLEYQHPSTHQLHNEDAVYWINQRLLSKFHLSLKDIENIEEPWKGTFF